MTNGEKYKTAHERAEAFRNYFNGDPLDLCSCEHCVECQMEWLDREAEEKPLPCPFCRSECKTEAYNLGFVVSCVRCGYRSEIKRSKDYAIAAHNRVAKKCREGKE